MAHTIRHIFSTGNFDCTLTAINNHNSNFYTMPCIAISPSQPPHHSRQILISVSISFTQNLTLLNNISVIQRKNNQTKVLPRISPSFFNPVPCSNFDFSTNFISVNFTYCCCLQPVNNISPTTMLKCVHMEFMKTCLKQI